MNAGESINQLSIIRYFEDKKNQRYNEIIQS